MTSKLQLVRGMKDLLPADFAAHHHIIAKARHIASMFGFMEMTPPVVEATSVFQRTLGETSDIVSKEMYSFTDRGGDSLTLRPEFTAGVMRAVLNSGAWTHPPLKYFTVGPLFRQERPQSGRYRQFHQINCEYLGASQPEDDAEMIALAATILRELGILDKVTLHLNSIGDTASRDAYRDNLRAYFQGHYQHLSDESKERLQKNPLRILDSKDPEDKKLVEHAPKIQDSYTPEAAEFFARLCATLDLYGIAYTITPTLVRGLDYYCHTTFEFVTEALGAQGTVLGGGRYDGLAAIMGGQPLAAIGFASGIERLAALCNYQAPAPASLAVIPVGTETYAPAIKLASQLRTAGIQTHLFFDTKLAKSMKKADNTGASYAILLGSNELAAGQATVKHFATSTTETLPLDTLVTIFQNRLLKV